MPKRGRGILTGKPIIKDGKLNLNAFQNITVKRKPLTSANAQKFKDMKAELDARMKKYRRKK